MRLSRKAPTVDGARIAGHKIGLEIGRQTNAIATTATNVQANAYPATRNVRRTPSHSCQRRQERRRTRRRRAPTRRQDRQPPTRPRTSSAPASGQQQQKVDRSFVSSSRHAPDAMATRRLIEETYTISRESSGGGQACPHLQGYKRSVSCPCPPQPCEYSAWATSGKCTPTSGTCGAGKQTMVRTVTKGGDACNVALQKTTDCTIRCWNPLPVDERT